jgi:hypothetical protein
MWLLGGISSRYKRVAGGRQASQRCEDCEKVTQFWEATVTDKVSVFFVSVGATQQRRMVCDECGHDVELEAERKLAVPRASTMAKPPRPSDKELSNDLAALKRKMGL